MVDDKIINVLLKLSKKAYKKNEVPVSCIIIRKNKIISKAYNLKEKYNNPLYHAEILAIEKACKKLKNWRLDDCKLIVSLKPCKMCTEIIKEARIKEVYYILESFNDEKTNESVISTKIDYEKEKFYELLTNFFKYKR